MKKIVTCVMDWSSIDGETTLGRKCEVRGEYFRNGESHFKLTCLETGKKFNSPTVFWS